MSTILTVHIGGGKTGSSAIQRFLKDNASALASDGVLVPPQDLRPGSPVSGYHVWFFDELRQIGSERGSSDLAALLDRLVAEHPSPVKQVILSAENLSNTHAWSRFFAGLADRYEIKIVFYVRRQDEYLLSAWQQWFAKRESDFWAWLTRNVGMMGNWRLPIQDWEKVAKPENICVRVYDRQRLAGGDVIKDFRDFIQSSAPLQSIEKIVNPSFNAGVLELIEGNAGLFKSVHDNGFYNLLQAATGNAHFNVRGQSIITFDQRMAILARYEQSNAWVFEKYVKRDGGPDTLFDMPVRADYRELSREEIEKQKWNVVVDLLYQLHAKPR